MRRNHSELIKPLSRAALVINVTEQYIRVLSWCRKQLAEKIRPGNSKSYPASTLSAAVSVSFSVRHLHIAALLSYTIGSLRSVEELFR